MIQLARFLGLISFSIGMVASQSVLAAKDIKSNYGIIHDSEFQVLLKQKGDDWNAEDKEIEARLDALRKKHGKRPNIIYIMWDDMKYGAIGHEMLNKVTGYTSPNNNSLVSPITHSLCSLPTTAQWKPRGPI